MNKYLIVSHLEL